MVAVCVGITTVTFHGRYCDIVHFAGRHVVKLPVLTIVVSLGERLV